jgi:hypothetical protein
MIVVIDECQSLHVSDPDFVATAALRTAFEGNSHWWQILMTDGDRCPLALGCQGSGK